MPSRGSFNTGFYPHATTVRFNPSALPSELPILAERLRDAAWDTAAFGHIGRLARLLERPGFPPPTPSANSPSPPPTASPCSGQKAPDKKQVIIKTGGA